MANISKIKLGNEVKNLRDNASLHYIGAIATLPESSATTITTDLVSGHTIAVFDQIIVGTGRASYVCTAITPAADPDPAVVTWTLISEAAAEIPVTDVKIGDTSIVDDTIATIPVATTSNLGLVQVGTSLAVEDGVVDVPEATTSSAGIVILADTVDGTSATASTDVPTVSAVATAIAELPQAMIFRGTLGTGGTITVLPTAGADYVGDTYKVITKGTYDSQAAEVGDLFICAQGEDTSGGTPVTTYSWVLIPSGDVPAGTVTSVQAAAVANSGLILGTGAAGASGDPITSSGTITVGVDSDHAIPETTDISTWNDTATQVAAFSNDTAVTDVSTTAPVSPATATAVQVLEIDSNDTEQLNVNTIYVYAGDTAVFGTIQ